MIKEYLKSKEYAWADSTKKSEAARLKRIACFVEAGDPQKLWEAIEHLAPYSRVTAWTRAADYYEFLLTENIKTGSNIFNQWRNKNAKAFKNSYERKTPEVSYGDAKEKINSISCEKTRRKAHQLLKAGLRYRESFTVNSGKVKGKGSKTRTIFSETQKVDYPYSYSHFRKVLKKETGLKPHDLRKIRATDLARRGMKESDLCKVFGWESFATASSYIAPMNDDKIEALMKD